MKILALMGLSKAPEMTESVIKVAGDHSNKAVYGRRSAAEALGTVGTTDVNFDRAVDTLCHLATKDDDHQVQSTKFS